MDVLVRGEPTIISAMPPQDEIQNIDEPNPNFGFDSTVIIQTKVAEKIERYPDFYAIFSGFLLHSHLTNGDCNAQGTRTVVPHERPRLDRGRALRTM
jgi:hypothetical protein